MRSDDVLRVLTKSRELKKPTFVKPDLSLLQRKCESILLKERWSFIQSGESCNSIKICNSKLFLNKKLYGFCIDSTNVFHLSTIHPDKASEYSTPLGDEHASVSHVRAQSVGPGGSDESS